MVPNSPDKKHFPSPGQYDAEQSVSHGTIKKSLSTPELRKSSSMGSSPRFAGPSTVLRGDAVVAGAHM